MTPESGTIIGLVTKISQTTLERLVEIRVLCWRGIDYGSVCKDHLIPEISIYSEGSSLRTAYSVPDYLVHRKAISVVEKA